MKMIHLWGLAGIVLCLALAGYLFAPQLHVTLAPAESQAAMVRPTPAELSADIANRQAGSLLKRQLSQGYSDPHVKILFKDPVIQGDFEKISTSYAECLADVDCVIKGSLWKLYVALQQKSPELGEETVKYYVINLLNHMMRKMEVATDFREVYRQEARQIIMDVNKDSPALSPDWIILADISYQSGDVEEAKRLYQETLTAARQKEAQMNTEETVDVDTLERVRSRCFELGCEVTADLNSEGEL